MVQSLAVKMYSSTSNRVNTLKGSIMKEPYRDILEQQVRDHVIRRLAVLLSMFNSYDPVYTVIKSDIKKLVLTH